MQLIIATSHTIARIGTPAVVWIPGGDGGPLPIAVRVGQRDANGARLLEGPLPEGQPLIVGVLNTERRLVGEHLGL
jgi:HlyD family secretion protein